MPLPTPPQKNQNHQITVDYPRISGNLIPKTTTGTICLSSSGAALTKEVIV